MMRMNKNNILGAVAVGLLAVGGSAAIAGSKAGNPPAPKEVKDMDCLLGNWKGTGTMQMGADTADVKLTWSCKRASGDWGVSCQLKLTGIPGMASYEETDLFGYDPGAGKYHWFAVTNAGETHDHVASVPTGDTIDWVYTGVQEGKPFKETVRMTFDMKAKTIDFKAETFLDGKSTSVFTGHAKK